MKLTITLFSFAMSFIAFSQTTIKKAISDKMESLSDVNITLNKSIVLDEVVVIAYGGVKRTDMIYCCGKTTQCVLECDVKGEKIKEASKRKKLIKLILYPNPSKGGLFKMKLNSNYKKIQIQVNGISGQLIKTFSYQNVNNEVRIDLSQYPSGIYIINIIANGKQLAAKKAIIG